MSGSMEVRYVHSQETKKVGIGTEYVGKHLAQSFSAWDLCNCGEGSADIFSRVMSSLRTELLYSYFDGNLNTVFLTLIKTAIIHNWKMFSQPVFNSENGRHADLGVGVVVVQRYLLRGWLCWNFCPRKGKSVYSTPRLKSTDPVQLHVSTEHNEAQRGPGPCWKSSSKSEADLRLQGWANTAWP